MPVSSREGKDWMVERIVAHQPATVLDVGAGAGIYEELLRPRLPDARFIAIEVWQPYVQRFGLADRYDEVIVGDVTRMRAELPTVDVVILGDILEHLNHLDAWSLWDRARTAAQRAVFLSLPIVDYPQGEVDGNPYEAHLHQWTDAAVKRELAGIVASFRLPWPQTIGAYEAEPARRMETTSW